jgi:hypothetical protein
MIRYELIDVGYRVYLDEKPVGKIKTVIGGYRYVPNGYSPKQGGEIFASLDKCKKSLEDD